MPPSDASPSSKPAPKPQIGTVVNLVKEYAKQETVGPLKGAGRWLAFGAAGAFLFGLGIIMLVLGLLRFVQTQWGDTFDGNWSVVPYVFALVLCVAAIGLAVSRIHKKSLAKEPR